MKCLIVIKGGIKQITQPYQNASDPLFIRQCFIKLFGKLIAFQSLGDISGGGVEIPEIHLRIGYVRRICLFCNL